MWPMGFISLSSSMRKAEEAKKSSKKPTKVSRTNIRLSPSSKASERKVPKGDKQNIVKKRLEFYESNESEDSKNKLNLKSFAQFAVSTPERKKLVGDPQKFISKSLSLQSDEEEIIVPQRTTPVFRSSSHFEKYFSEGDGEGSTFSGHADSDVEGASVSRASQGSPTGQIFSDQEQSFVVKSLPTSPKIKKVQFNPSQTTVYPNKILESSPGRSMARNAEKSKSPKFSEEDSECEDMSQKEWYKQVFRVVHKLDNLYSSYPIPQVDDNENLIPPRPRTRKDFGRNSPSSGFVASSTSKSTRSNSLPSTCRTECQPIQTSFKNSKRLVLTTEGSQNRKAEADARDRVVLKKHQKQEADENPLSEDEWRQFLRPTKSSIKLFEEKNEVKRAIAQFDFYAHYSNELSFRRGDHLILVRTVDEHWYEAEIDGKRGLVPSNYLEVIKTPSNACPEPDEASGLVLKDFQARYPSEISAKKNDVVRVIRHLRGDWLEVRLGSRSGLLPAHHVCSYLNNS